MKFVLQKIRVRTKIVSQITRNTHFYALFELVESAGMSPTWLTETKTCYNADSEQTHN